MKGYKIAISVEQAAELVRVLPPCIEHARKIGEKILVISIKTPENAPSPEEMKAFLEGKPRDHREAILSSETPEEKQP